MGAAPMAPMAVRHGWPHVARAQN